MHIDLKGRSIQPVRSYFMTAIELRWATAFGAGEDCTHFVELALLD